MQLSNVEHSDNYYGKNGEHPRLDKNIEFKILIRNEQKKAVKSPLTVCEKPHVDP